MKIKKIEIVNFGKLSDFTLDFENRFQVIFGNNEDGKSTVMAFIMLMLYSDHGRPRSLQQMTRQLYLPWNGAPMEGAMELSHRGISYRLQKLFGETAGKDKITLINTDRAEEIGLARGMEVGKHFLGLDLASFKRSCFVKQLGSVEPGKDSDDVAEKLLINLVSDGGDESAQQDVLSRLESAKLKLVSKSGTKGILAEAQGNLQNLKEERDQVRQLLLSQEQLQEEYAAIKERLDKQSWLSQTIKDIQLKEQARKLEGLLTLQNSAEPLREKLLEGDSSVEIIEAFFMEGDRLLEDCRQKKETIKSREDKDQGFVFITEEEHQHFDQLLEKTKEIDRLLESYENSVVPALEKSSILETALESSKNTQNALKTQLEALEPQKLLKEKLEAELKSNTEDYNSKQALLSQKEEYWTREKELQTREIESYGTKVGLLEQNAKKRPNLLLLFLGILIVGGSVAAWYWVDPLFVWGSALGLLFVILAFIKSVKKEDPALEETKLLLEQSGEKLFRWEQQTLGEITDLKASFLLTQNNLQHCENQLKELEYSFEPEAYSQGCGQLEQLTRELIRLELEQTSAKENGESLFQQLVDDSGKIGITLSDQPETQLNQRLSVVDGKLKDLMISKEVVNSSEFKAKFLSSQAKEKNLASTELINQELIVAEKEFTTLVSSRYAIADFPSAAEIYHQTSDQYKQLVEQEKEILLTAKAMGIGDWSVAGLEKMLESSSHLPKELPSNQLEELTRELGLLKEENLLGKMEEIQKMIRPPARNLEQIGLEISELTEQVNESRLYYDGLSLAFEKMTDANEEMRQSFGPILNQKTGEIFSRLTRNKYDQVLVNKDYDIQFRTGAHFREWQYLSSGTTDQAYLALRLAMSELIASQGESVPLFLDDILVQYDDNRAEAALEFLEEYSSEKSSQLILFTCHNRILNYAEKLKVATMKIG